MAEGEYVHFLDRSMFSKKVYTAGIADVRGLSGRGVYRAWASMLQRCYVPTEHMRYKRTMCEQWHYLSEFKKWYDVNYRHGFILSKDIIAGMTDHYSPETCIYVPAWLAKFVHREEHQFGRPRDLPTGVYKRRDGYVVSVRHQGESVHVGVYTDRDRARLAWGRAKFSLLSNRRAEIEAIDPRLYPALKERYIGNNCAESKAVV